MRITVTLDDDLYRRAKVKAAQEGTTFSALVAEALVRRLGEAEPFQFTVCHAGGGLRPGLSTDDISVLLDLIDEEEDRIRYQLPRLPGNA
jgi:hypothetical protein